MLFNQQLEIAYHYIYFEQSQIYLTIKRLDQIHPLISGNKYFKLKHNVQEALQQGSKALVTFGGAYSNHIAAVAAIGAEMNIPTIGIIRGEELQYQPLNHTLSHAQRQGMRLKFISRKAYREKQSPEFLTSLLQEFPHSYVIPEGGTNNLAVQGCKDILTDADKQHDVICCAVGTGGTLAGLIESTQAPTQILGFAALKGHFLDDEVAQWTTKQHWRINNDYHFGGYAKVQPQLIGFIEQVQRQYGIPLDPIYTGKMLFGVFDLIAQGYFPAHSRILALHTGGLQGNPSMLNSDSISNI